MRDLGLGALAHATYHASFINMETEAARWQELCVLQAAHAAELLVKARIAQEHPLLIFDQLPRSTQAAGSHLDIEDLFRQGRTVQWSDLPDRLWAATGLVMPEREKFESFGCLRNGIQHFAAPSNVDTAKEALNFIFAVIGPFINSCWGLFAIDYNEDYEPYLSFVSAMVGREIPFLVSPEAAKCFEDWEVSWNDVSPSYRELIRSRVEAAKVL